MVQPEVIGPITVRALSNLAQQNIKKKSNKILHGFGRKFSRSIRDDLFALKTQDFLWPVPPGSSVLARHKRVLVKTFFARENFQTGNFPWPSIPARVDLRRSALRCRTSTALNWLSSFFPSEKAANDLFAWMIYGYFGQMNFARKIWIGTNKGVDKISLFFFCS